MKRSGIYSNEDRDRPRTLRSHAETEEVRLWEHVSPQPRASVPLTRAPPSPAHEEGRITWDIQRAVDLRYGVLLNTAHPGPSVRSEKKGWV